MNNNQELDLLGIWEQMGYLNPASKSLVQWSSGSPPPEYYSLTENIDC